MGRGEWYRWNKRKTTDDVPQLDIRRLDKGVLRRPGTICIAMGGDRVRYQFTVHADRLHVTSHRLTVYLDRTACHYGGERLWFKCPACSTRVAVLYDVNQTFRCRQCHGIVHQSKRENEADRALRKALKVRDRLRAPSDLSEPIYHKPKGMHWKTFERLRHREACAGLASVMAMRAKIGIGCQSPLWL